MQPACSFPVTSPGTASFLTSDKKFPDWNQGNYRDSLQESMCQ